MPPTAMPPHASLAALALLGTAALLIVCLLAVVAGSVSRQWKMTRWGSLAAALLAGGYAAILIGSSLPSRDRILKPGDAKIFCELDCHLAYSVDGIESEPVGAATRYHIVLRTWFDPATIAPFRGDALLAPNPRIVYLLDGAGHRHPAPTEAVAALAKPLRPGESYRTSLEFRLPFDAGTPKLFVGDPPGPEALLIGHENAPFHGRIYFGLEPHRSARRSPVRTGGPRSF
jgi:hypothetical protein